MHGAGISSARSRAEQEQRLAQGRMFTLSDGPYAPGMLEQKLVGRLSEFCHPNFLGHFLTFADLNTDSGTVLFSDTRRYDKGMLHNIAGSIFAIGLVDEALEQIDEFRSKVAELQSGEAL